MRHLSTNDLITYAEQRTTLRLNEFIESHIRTCPLCDDESSFWTDFLLSLTAPDLRSAPEAALRKCFALYQMPQRTNGLIREIFARLVFDSAIQPAMAGIRGEADSHHIVLEADDVEVYLRISGGSREILGQLMFSNGSFIAGARASLLRAGETIDMTVTDTLGEFRFNQSPHGALRLQSEIAPDRRLIADFQISKAPTAKDVFDVC